MPLFGKKPRVEVLPIEKVIQLRKQGYSDDQIISELQQEGYSSSQIFDAMSQADLQAESFTPEQMQQPEMQPLEEESQSIQQMQPPITETPSTLPLEMERERIEEIVETMIEEKWSELTKDIMKIIEWKEKTEAEIAKINMAIEDLKNQFAELRQAILGKISEYDKHMIEIGSDIKALDKAFKEILPTLTENVNELSRITKVMKGKKG